MKAPPHNSDSDNCTQYPNGMRATFPNINSLIAGLSILLGSVLLIIIPGQVGRPPVLFGVASSNLDPALFPRIVAAGFILIGVAYLVQSRRMNEKNDLRELDLHVLFRLGVTLLIFLFFAATLVRLGFLMSSFFALAALSGFLGARNIPAILITAAVVPLAVYYIFTTYLLVVLPGIPQALPWN